MVRLLVALAALALVLAVIAAYAGRVAVNSEQFANRATTALRDESVNSLLAQKITDEVVLKRKADLIAARPLIEAVAAEIVRGRAFTGLFRHAVEDVHRALFKRDRSTVTLTIADVGTVLAGALEQIRPALADRLRSTERVEIVTRDLGAVSEGLIDVGERIRRLGLLLAAVALVLAAAALYLSSRRRRTVIDLAVAVTVMGVLLVVAFALLRGIVAGSLDTPEQQAAARAVWDAFLGDLRTLAWILAGAGALAAAAASSLFKPAPFGEPVRVAGRWIATEPRRPALRTLRGGAFVAAGIAALVNRDAAVALLVTAAAVYLIYEGAAAILRLVYRPEEQDESRRAVAGLRQVPRRVAVVALPAVVIVVAIATFLGTGGVTTAAPARGLCNGHAELCDMRLDEVALATTHNSMSVPLPGWYSSQQERPIADQLRDGIRGLQIDTHYADALPNGNVRTYFPSQDDLRRRVKADGVSDQSVDAALRLRDRLGFQGEGERGIYLCHSFCELGATRLDSVLADLRTFLVSNPGAVLVVINQDYVTPEDFVEAVRGADLEELVFKGPLDGRWPTLREMVDSGERLVLLAEENAGGAPWYRPAYDAITQETPYSFGKVGQLTKPARLPVSCAPNRGPADAPILLINHWITTDPLPLPSNSTKVNAYAPLMARARECARIRGQAPNLVAVNFYLRGDLFRVVDELNGVR